MVWPEFQTGKNEAHAQCFNSTTPRAQVHHDGGFLIRGQSTCLISHIDWAIINVLGPHGCIIVVRSTEFISLRADEHLEPLIALHQGMEDSLRVGPLQKHEPDVNEALVRPAPTYPIDTPLALFHLRG